MLIRKILLVIILTSFFSNISLARTLPEDKRAAIDQILSLNNTVQLLPLMSSAISGQIIRAMSQRNGEIDQNLIELTQAEVKSAVHEEFVLKNTLNEIFYQLYDEYFTTEQLQEIAKFNASEAGKRLNEYGVKISQRSMIEAKEAAKTIGAIVHKRMLKKLDKIEKRADLLNADKLNN